VIFDEPPIKKAFEKACGSRIVAWSLPDQQPQHPLLVESSQNVGEAVEAGPACEFDL
jgi:hypothetical protein